ncbi:MAG TPA: hypothetical protein VJ853_04940, partial [Thermoanaerobaculia bacterium]|nr:hypothetical protein [Thermoanaerobaculia bacterium]
MPSWRSSSPFWGSIVSNALVLVGLNHRTAPVDVRERLSDVPLADLKSMSGVEGAALLSTCNRVE